MRIVLGVIGAILIWKIGGGLVQAFSGDVHYDYGQIVEGLLNPVEGGECLLNFNRDHKAVDITAECGTPVMAACDGRLSGFFGLSDEPIIKAPEKGLDLDDLENCKDDDKDWSGYRIFYGCIDTDDTSTRSVKQGDIIGTVGECDRENGCHIHFVLVDGALGGDGGVSACVPVV
jgi:hypothetical protein